MTRQTRMAFWVSAVGLAVWGVGCSDDGRRVTDPPVPADSAIVSEAVPNASIAAETARGDGSASFAAPAEATDATDVAYVSLPPGTIRNGAAATISNRRTGSSVTVRLADGGFDPAPVPARAGDELDLVVTDGGGTAVYSATVTVPVRRPPKVVRTIPPKGKTDVPLNARIVVVFSEPVDGTTLTPASIRLMRGPTAVAGAIRFLDPTLDATHVSVEFVPTVQLDPRTQYQLVVTRDVRDLSGEPLSAAETMTFTTGASSAGPPASLRLWPDSILDLGTGATYQLTAMVQDAAGSVLTDNPVAWSSSDPSGLAVSPTGLLTALSDGTYQVTASVAGLSRLLTVFVRAGHPASVTVAPTPATVTAGDTIILAATVRDAAGRVIRRPSVTWVSSAPAVATAAPLDAGNPGPVGIVLGVTQGNVTITATSGAASGTASVTVGPRVPVASVRVVPASATLLARGTVLLAATLRDANGKVLFARPTAWTTDNPAVATVDATGLVTGIGVGSATVTATSEGMSGPSGITVTVISFASVQAGDSHSCGLGTNGAAYCWGNNDDGQLGDGSTSDRLVPVAVTGGLRFTALGVAHAGYGAHTCALTITGAAYCWGLNRYGQLGTGSATGPESCLASPSGQPHCSTVPMAVSGALTFSALSAGTVHTCGLTTSGVAYCWGFNGGGQLGTGSLSHSPTPVAVSGGLTFSVVSAGSSHTCGVTAGGDAYCWGSNFAGQIGDGSMTRRSAPVAVAGGLKFSTVSAGYKHTCGLTISGDTYCWGQTGGTGLDDVSIINYGAVPAAVPGSLRFAAVSAGRSHTCGLTADGGAYCWGSNAWRQLGADPDLEDLYVSREPVPVAGGLAFSSVSAGGQSTCGMSTTAIAYCWGQIGGTVPTKVAGQP